MANNRKSDVFQEIIIKNPTHKMNPIIIIKNWPLIYEDNIISH